MGVCVLLAVAAGTTVTARADDVQWRIEKPSNSGIPGEEIRFLRFNPDGDVTVGARWSFWGEGGLGILRRGDGAWTTYANWETPIPSPYVNDLEFDAAGVGWLATGGGLVRWEGDEWRVYDSSNSPLLHDEVRNLSVAPNGHVWVNNSNVRDNNAAIFEFDGVNWRKFAVPADLPWEDPWRTLSDVVVDALGNVWVANNTLPGLAKYDGVSWRLYGESVATFRRLTPDRNGHIWMIEGGLGYTAWRFDGSEFIPFGGSRPPIGTTTITDLALDDDGTMFLGNWMGQLVKTTDGGASWSVFRMDLSRIVEVSPDPRTTDVWVGTAGAVGHYRADATWVRDYNSYNTGMPWYWVDQMMTDNDGNFWVATGEAGLSRFDGRKWRNWGNHNAYSEEYPFRGNEPMGAAFQDSQGMIWMGGNGVARWDPVQNVFTGFWNWQNTPIFGVTLFTDFVESPPGYIWASTAYGAVYNFDGTQWTRNELRPYENAFMEVDRAGNVWVAAWFALYRWDGAQWTEYDSNPSLFDLYGVTDMTIDRQDNLWLGCGAALVRFDGQRWSIFNTQNSPLPYRNVRGVAVRDDGLIGLAMSGDDGEGAAVIIRGDPVVPENWQPFLYGECPLPHWQVGDVAFDAQGDLWVSALSEGAAVLTVPPLGGCARDPQWVCDGDVDGNGTVNPVDVGLIQAAFCTADDCPAAALCQYDLDCNGAINPVDAGIVQSLFGTCPAPRDVCP
jgi:ligand-binding sensor domain-containing protein